MPQTGVIVEVDEEPVACGFLYKTDSLLCIFEWMIANPSAPKQKRNDGIEYLIEFSKFWAIENGFKLIYTSTGVSKFINRMVDHGYIAADSSQTHLFFKVE